MFPSTQWAAVQAVPHLQKDNYLKAPAKAGAFCCVDIVIYEFYTYITRGDSMFRYMVASEKMCEKRWQKIVDAHPGDVRWENWRREYMEYYRKGMAQYFVITDGEDPVGEVTLLYSPVCKALGGREILADMHTTANINGLRIDKHYEGQGHISKLMKAVEKYAAEKGYEYLTIGVTSTHTRTKGIYQHFGYTELLFSEWDDGVVVEYYRKKI